MEARKHGSGVFVGIDIGGTRCRVITSLTLGRLEETSRCEFVLSRKFEVDMAELIGNIRRLTGDGTIAAIGLGIPGDLNAEKTAFNDPAANLTEWSDKPIKMMLEQEFGCPLFMDNDAVTAALGEAYYGLGKDREFAFVIWGTGIGGAKVEVRHGERVCTKLNWYRYFEGWERHCGGNKIRELYGKEASTLSQLEWGKVMDDFRRELAAFIDKTASQFVVFGGGIAIKQKERLLHVAAGFKEIDLQVSQLGEDAGLYGALALLTSELG